jgi:plasmid stability protein
MAGKTMTLSFPDDLYDRLKQRAEQTHHSLEEEALGVLAAALPADDRLPNAIEGELASLAALDDEGLWQAARSRLTDDEVTRSEALHWKSQREGLSDTETQAAADLADTYERLMLVRAQAVALLKQRGYDVSSLLAPA